MLGKGSLFGPKLTGNALVRYEYPIANGITSAQISGRYWGNFCWSVFCGDVDIERPGYAADGQLAYEFNSVVCWKRD
jgi:hypothetical protein